MEETEQPKSFTNRELWMLIDKNNQTNLLQHQSIQDSIKDFHKVTKETLEEIVKQTKKTNGNVMDLLLWRMYIKGATYVIPLIVSAVISGVIGLIFVAFK